MSISQKSWFKTCLVQESLNNVHSCRLSQIVFNTDLIVCPCLNWQLF